MLTSLEFIDDTVAGYQEYNAEDNVYNKDLIASIRALISSVRSRVFAFTSILLIDIHKIKNSSTKKDQFAELSKMCNEGKELQLIRDVVTRWSSTVLMIKRIIKLRQVRDPISNLYSFVSVLIYF
jgi:hypothetical protein